MNTIKIFLASSAELLNDRKAFRELLSVENNRYHYKGVYLELTEWEYFFDAVSQNSKQGDYNEKIKECSIVVCLFYTKAGKYTRQEFDTALKQFHETGKPLIYTYFKEPDKTGVPGAGIPDPSLKQFKDRLMELGHFYTRYKNTEDLQLHFKMQLDILADKGFVKLQQDIKKETMEAVTNYLNISINIKTANVGGNNNTTVQDGTVTQSTIHADNQCAEKIVNLGSNVGNINL